MKFTVQANIRPFRQCILTEKAFCHIIKYKLTKRFLLKTGKYNQIFAHLDTIMCPFRQNILTKSLFFNTMQM